MHALKILNGHQKVGTYILIYISILKSVKNLLKSSEHN